MKILNVFKKLLIATALPLFVVSEAHSKGNLSDYVLLPTVEYYDCSNSEIPPGVVSYVEGKEYEVFASKGTDAFSIGSQFFIAVDSDGEFAGLFLDSYKDGTVNDIFFEKSYLDSMVFLEANDLNQSKIINGFHLPVYTFSTCPDVPAEKGSVCIDVGYLKTFSLWSDIAIPIVKSKFSKKTKVSKVGLHYNNILTDRPENWSSLRLVVTWDADHNVETMKVGPQGETQKVDVLLGMLQFQGENFLGTEDIYSVLMTNHEDPQSNMTIHDLASEFACGNL